MKKTICVLFFFFCAIGVAQEYVIKNEADETLKKINVSEQLGQVVSKNIVFTDEDGKSVRFADFFNKEKPTILVLAYYECPMLCGIVLNAVKTAVQKTDLVLGKDYQIITISINPLETSELAKKKQENFVSSLMPTDEKEKSRMKQGWRFFVGQEENIRTVAKTIGFEYQYLEDKKEYAHPAVITFLSEEGKVTRYLFGVEFKPEDFKLSILEASEGKVGTIIDKVILSCFQYDPDAKSFVPVARNIMKIGGLIIVLILGATLGLFWIRDNKKYKNQPTTIT